MKLLFKVITHPLFVILFFCGLVISGEAMGGFYLFYILLGLPHFVLHSVFGVLGITCLLGTYFIKPVKPSLLSTLGGCFMIISLLYFFLQPNGSYNYNTFHETMPMTLLVVFSIVITTFVVLNIYLLASNAGNKNAQSFFLK